MNVTTRKGRSIVVGIRPENLADPVVAGIEPEPGSSLSVEVAVDVERLHYFDPATGLAIGATTG
jgi:hypothetical protein